MSSTAAASQRAGFEAAEDFLATTRAEHEAAVAAARSQREGAEDLLAEARHKHEEDVRVSSKAQKRRRRCSFRDDERPRSCRVPLTPSFPSRAHPYSTSYAQGVKLVAARMIKEREDAILQLKRELAKRREG